MYVHDPNLEPYINEHWASNALLATSPIEDVPQVLGPEKRQEFRLATNEAAFVYSLNPLMPGSTLVRIVDVSKRGLKLHIDRRIEPGTEVQVKLDHVFVTGEIRYCVQVGSFFLAGVLVDDVFWSRS